jgi:hypothetical protein
MRRSFICFLFLLVQCSNILYAQKTTATAKQSNIIFRDTVGNFVFDSVSHNLGRKVFAPGNQSLVKHFKYIGKNPVIIASAFTSDPHYICKYPTEPLKTGQVYSFTVCFTTIVGVMYKVMGFVLPDEQRISLTFKAEGLPASK